MVNKYHAKDGGNKAATAAKAGAVYAVTRMAMGPTSAAVVGGAMLGATVIKAIKKGKKKNGK
jgi:hypothetical protein